MFEGPEKKFQRHIADFLVHEHGFAVLTQEEITDKEYFFAEDHLYAFLKATQSDTLVRLEEDYGDDTRDEIFKALREELARRPLWSIIRTGLSVRGRDIKLYFPKPRSSESVANVLYAENRITFIPELVIRGDNRLDFGLFLNGLPIATVELKHEKNQNVHDAVAQYTTRDHSDRIFQLPFLHIAADTSDVQVATDPRAEKNFRWFNTGLTNQAATKGEYPVEFLYREVLSKDSLLQAVAFYLVRAPQQAAAEDRPERPASTIFPRYHQRRCVEKIAAETQGHFAKHGDVGRKFLINHSAGSGKTLTMCWMADRLHSLFKPGTSEKMVNMVFLLTDRKSLDKNIREDIEKFSHLKNMVRYAKRSGDLGRFLREREQIIVTTQQKFHYILSKIAGDEGLKRMRVTFLIDEAHRSQEGRMATAIRMPFRSSAPDIMGEGLLMAAEKPAIYLEGDADEDIEPAVLATEHAADEPDAEDAQDQEDPQETIARIIKEHDLNQLFVAFTATPSPATVQLFGEPFDTYSEAEAIQEGYIVDVAQSIISYKTLYNLHCPIIPSPEEEKLYPPGIVAKALKNIAYQDSELIQYKAEVMLRIFEEQVRPLLEGRSKAMIVSTSRLAGLEYHRVIQKKLEERGADYKVLYAFSDFVHPDTNKIISEHALNGLKDGELIEDRFEEESYRLMIVASKFQTGFDQPLLAGMFLDKAVADRNAVQTISRLMRVATALREHKVPTLEQIKHVIKTMPTGTDIARRNRALVAFTLLTGARDRAIASMKLKHVDLVNDSIYQDAREVKTKYSKTFSTFFFPVGEEIRLIVAEWVTYLRDDKLCGNDDPLFPATRMALGASCQFEVAGLAPDHWRTASPIRKIFQEAFVSAGLPYFNPHSFRNTLVQLGQDVCKTPEEFKAWSQNLGHEKVLTTFLSYGGVAYRRQGEIIKGLGAPHSGKQTNVSELAEAFLSKLRESGVDVVGK